MKTLIVIFIIAGIVVSTSVMLYVIYDMVNEVIAKKKQQKTAWDHHRRKED